MIDVLKAPPFAIVQDLGWNSGRAIGLPPGGAMDRALLAAANEAVGNPPGAAVLEWALGTGSLRFEAEATVAVVRDAGCRVDGVEHSAGVVMVPPRGVLEVFPRGSDRFVYVAVRGGIDVPEVLGSRATYLPGGFGGFEGRRLKTGDRLPLGHLPRQRMKPYPAPTRVPDRELTLRVTRGPQWDQFDPAVRAGFLAGKYLVAAASDRMGYRLEGPAIHPQEAATLPSEPACPGAIQIPGGGQPIVLMPDGPTVGGYPKIAVVVRADLARLAQCQPGRVVQWEEVSLLEARDTW